MKITTLVLSAALLVSVTSCNKKEEAAEAQKPATATQANISLASISIPTARCEECEETITKALKGVPGVTDAKVSADAEKATVQYDSTKTNLASLEKAIVLAGYNANSSVRDSAAHANLPECCQ